MAIGMKILHVGRPFFGEVNLGADALAAGIQPAIPMEVSPPCTLCRTFLTDLQLVKPFEAEVCTQQGAGVKGYAGVEGSL